MLTQNFDKTVHGIVVPLITPLQDEDRLDRSGLEHVIEHVISGGVSGIFVLGTTGETPSLSYEMRREMTHSTCRQVGGRVPVLVGVTDCAYAQTLALARAAADSGAAALVIAPPFYFRISQSDLSSYAERFARESPLPVFLYNIPSLTKIAFEVETVQRLSAVRGVVGLKDSSGDLDYLRSVVRSANDGFPVMMGPEEMLVDAMRSGATGGVCGGANLNPKLFVELYRAMASGDFENAERLQAQVREMSDALYTVGDQGTSYLRGLKWAMAKSGLCSGACALPVAPFTPDEERVLESRYEKLGRPV